ncbi:unnamed protein product, partial [Ectocarpus sp. 12 AP-2014]
GDRGAAAAVSTVVSCSRAPFLPPVSQRGGDAEQGAGGVWLDFRAVYARHGVTKLVEQYRADNLRDAGPGAGQLPSVAGDSAAGAGAASESTTAVVKRDGPAAASGIANGASTVAAAAEAAGGAGLSSGVDSGANVNGTTSSSSPSLIATGCSGAAAAAAATAENGDSGGECNAVLAKLAEVASRLHPESFPPRTTTL